MVSARTATAMSGLVGSLLISALLWWYFHTAVFFLFLPFVPFFFWRSDSGRHEEMAKECPTCGFHTVADSYEYCPRDGTPLEEL